MPARRQSVALTDAYRARLLTLRQETVYTLARSWRDIDPADVRSGFAGWLGTAVPVIDGAKRRNVTLADSYLSAYMTAELGTDVPRRDPDPEPYLVTADGRTTDRTLSPVLFVVLGGLAAGMTATRALQSGLARANRTVGDSLVDAPRRALRDLMASDDRIMSEHRVVAGNACGACLARAGQKVSVGSEYHVHTSCRCTWEPDLRGVPERFRRPTGQEIFDAMTPAEQDSLFHGRGGAEKAELIRTGSVPLDALVSKEPQAVTADQFTEASLTELRRRIAN